MAKNKIEIIHQDNDIVVINKPAGISVTADRSGSEDLLPILNRQLAPKEPLRLIHRLDKFISGVMVLAKNLPAQSQYSSWFEKRKIKKTYLALTIGHLVKPSGTIKTPIARSRKDPRIMRIDTKRGKPAITNYQLLADFGSVALLAVEPETERTHQIRVHLAIRDIPLAIDPLYGPTRPIMLSDIKFGYRRKKDIPESPLIDRLTLHAYKLELPRMDNQSVIDTYIAALDKKFAAAIKMLTKHNPKGPDAFSKLEDFNNILAAKNF